MPKKDYTQTAKEKKLPLQEHFDDVMKDFNRSNKYVTSHYIDRWANNTKLYNNERTDVQYLGSSDIFVPETFTILQTIKAHILGGDPQITFDSTRVDQNTDTEILSKMIDFVWQQDAMDSKFDLCIDDMLAIGNSYLVSFWDAKRKLPTSRYFNAQDMFFDISSGVYEGMRFFGYRYLTTKESLENETIVNPTYEMGETGSETLIKRYKNLDEVKPLAAYGSDKLAKAEKENMLVGAQYNDPDMVEVLVYNSLERLITVVNRRVVIEDIETPFQRKETAVDSVDDQGVPTQATIPGIDPFLPFAPFRGYVDGNLWYARSEIDIIGGLQERLNDVKTQKFDNLSHLLNKMFTLDPAYADRVEEVVSAPGAVLTFPAGALDEITTTSIGRDADDEIESLKNSMQRATAADELVQGSAQDKGMMTAEEVRAQIAQAGTRFARKLKQVSNEGLRIWATNIFKLLQIYVDQEVAIKMVGPEGESWQAWNPGEYAGEYIPNVMLEAEKKAKNEEEKQNAMQFYLLASKAPFVDQMKLFVMTGKEIFNKSEEELKNILQTPQPMTDAEGRPVDEKGLPIPTTPDGIPLDRIPQPKGGPEGGADNGGQNVPIDNSIPGGMPAGEGMPMDAQSMNMAGMPTS
jgi:hypothetical protein